MHTFIMPLIMKENWCILIAYQTVTHVAVFVLHARCLYKQEMQAKSESIILLINQGLIALMHMNPFCICLPKRKYRRPFMNTMYLT